MGQLDLTPIQKFENTNVSTYIKDMIIDQLLKGKLQPGDKLPTELELASQLNVGRNSVREAIKMLSTLGIIEICRGEGTFIRNSISESALSPLVIQLAFSRKAPQDLIELRIFLDTAIVELALRKMKDGDIEHLAAINEKMRIAIAGNAGVDLISQYDFEFHNALMYMCRNDLISKIGETVYTLFFSSISESILNNEYGGYGYQNHLKIIGALREGNIQTVRDAVDESLEHWKNQLVKS